MYLFIALVSLDMMTTNVDKEKKNDIDIEKAMNVDKEKAKNVDMEKTNNIHVSSIVISLKK